MLYCINPKCQNRQNSDNSQYCQSCGTKLLINERYRLVRPLRDLRLSSNIDVFEVEDQKKADDRGQMAEGIYPDANGTHHLATDKEQGTQAPTEIVSATCLEEGSESPSEETLVLSASWTLPFQQGTRKVLKVLKTDEHKYIELFEQEAELLTNPKLRHPGIPKAEPDEGFFFWHINGRELRCLVMEKIEGEDLNEWLKRNKRIRQDDLARQWLRQLAEILDWVHHKGFFHRDIKPLNIMLRPNGQLVLIDFGTAREITPTVIEQRGITAVSSYGYTAPEQAEGRAVPQSDFFALGRTFVHLLTGKYPEDLPKKPGTGQLMWRNAAPQVSKPLADFIDELMAPSVQDRPDNTLTILQRLKELPPPPAPPHRRLRDIGLIIGGISIGAAIAIAILNPPPKFDLCKASIADDVSAIDFSPDGKYVATASLDKTVQVLEITNSKPPAICQQHTDQHKEGVVAVKFSPDGKYIATASLDSTAGLGEIGKDGTISNFKLLPHGSPVVAIDFSPKDGQYLATAGSDGIVQIWDTKNHRQVALLKDNTYVRAVSFSQDGRYLATVSLDNKARVWDWNNHSFDQKYMSLPQKNVVAVAFSPKEGKYLATASADGSVQVWDTTSYKEIARLKDKTYVMAIKFSPDGRYLATVSLDNQVKVWEWEVNRNGQKALSLPQDNVVAVAFSPKDGKYLAMASDDGAAQVWETANAGRVKTVSHDGNSLVDIAFSPTDDQYLVTASADGTIKLTKW